MDAEAEAPAATTPRYGNEATDGKASLQRKATSDAPTPTPDEPPALAAPAAGDDSTDAPDEGRAAPPHRPMGATDPTVHVEGRRGAWINFGPFRINRDFSDSEFREFLENMVDKDLHDVLDQVAPKAVALGVDVARIEDLGFSRRRKAGTINIPTWRKMTRVIETKAPKAGMSVAYDIVSLACDAGLNKREEVLAAFTRFAGRRSPRSDHVRCNEEFATCRNMLNPNVWQIDKLEFQEGKRHNTYRFTRLQDGDGTVQT